MMFGGFAGRWPAIQGVVWKIKIKGTWLLWYMGIGAVFFYAVDLNYGKIER